FPSEPEAHPVAADDVPGELRRLEVAVKLAREELAHVRKEAARKVGEHDARIFLVHLQVLEDRTLQEQMEAAIREEGVSAEAGVAHVIGRYADAFSRLE